MDTLKALNTHEIRQVFDLMEKQWGIKKRSEYVFFMNSKNDLFITGRDISMLDTKKLRVNSVGLYVGQLLPNDRIRLSIEGTQLFGPLAKKNVCEISKEEAQKWIRGEDLRSEMPAGFAIIKSGKDYLGCGSSRDGLIQNYVPKSRRIKQETRQSPPHDAHL